MRKYIEIAETCDQCDYCDQESGVDGWVIEYICRLFDETLGCASTTDTIRYKPEDIYYPRSKPNWCLKVGKYELVHTKDRALEQLGQMKEGSGES